MSATNIGPPGQAALLMTVVQWRRRCGIDITHPRSQRLGLGLIAPRGSDGEAKSLLASLSQSCYLRIAHLSAHSHLPPRPKPVGCCDWLSCHPQSSLYRVRSAGKSATGRLDGLAIGAVGHLAVGVHPCMHLLPLRQRFRRQSKALSDSRCDGNDKWGLTPR